MKSLSLTALALALAFSVAACGDATDDAADDPGAPVAGDPLPDCEGTECDDDGVIDPNLDPELGRQDARAVLGMQEDDLPPEVRIARRGNETFALTEDYVIGRVTVELDDDDGSGMRVTRSTVELPDGPETFELEAS
jgi:hypothetical protein